MIFAAALVVFVSRLLCRIDEMEAVGAWLIVLESAMWALMTSAVGVILTVGGKYLIRYRQHRNETSPEGQFRAAVPAARQMLRMIENAPEDVDRPSPVDNRMQSFRTEMRSRFGVCIPFSLDPISDQVALSTLIGLMRDGRLADAQHQFPCPQESDQPPA